MSRACSSCGKTLGYRNRTGYCVTCGPKARGPEHRQRVSEGIRRRIALDPVYLEQKRAMAKALAANASVSERRSRHFNQAIRDKGNLASRSPEARAKAIRTRTETLLGWCPPELRDHYRDLTKKGIKAAEARAVIEQHHAHEMERFRRDLLEAAP